MDRSSALDLLILGKIAKLWKRNFNRKMKFYEKIIRPILFLLDPETAHIFTFKMLAIFDRVAFLNKLLASFFNFSDPSLKQKVFGLNFENPIGLAAGMDKKADLTLTWSAFNFGFAECGSITYQPQPGNARPRLWRLPQDKAILVHHGLGNLGAQASAKKLAQAKNRFKRNNILSLSIAKSNEVSMEEAAEDYTKSFQLLAEYADFITINLSCPNVKNFCGLQNKTLLEPILIKITNINTHQKPLCLKIGNDLTKNELDDIIFLVKKYNLAGIIATNSAKDRSRFNFKSKNKDKPGGVSGKPIAQRANEIIAYLYKHSENKFKIIGLGGVFTDTDAYKKIKAGATLVQLATGFIYGGPASIKNINQELVKLLQADKLTHINQAIGLEANNYHLF